jgi:hypothetical protein
LVEVQNQDIALITDKLNSLLTKKHNEIGLLRDQKKVQTKRLHFFNTQQKEEELYREKMFEKMGMTEKFNKLSMAVNDYEKI